MKYLEKAKGYGTYCANCGGRDLNPMGYTFEGPFVFADESCSDCKTIFNITYEITDITKRDEDV